MGRRLHCPNCGGESEVSNPGITMLVCSYCQTTLYWGADEVLQMGAQSILPEADTRLHLHATGKLRGVGFRATGHLRYDHGRGSWDEWYLELDDGRMAWVSEDERELSEEEAVQPDAELPAAAQLAVGQSVSMDSIEYTVREVGQATCIGGEGQLPFTVLPGEQYVYADVASLDGERFGTLEYDEGQRPTCFSGRVLGHEELTIDGEPPPTTARSAEAKHIKCTNCNGPLEVPGGREVETRVCEYCGAQLDLTSAEQRVLGVNPTDFDPQFAFEIGAGGEFHGKRYEVCGRMLYCDAEGYESREYLLYNPDDGYLWLAEEQGHFVVNRPTQQAPARDPFSLGTAQGIKIGSTRFRFYEQGIVKLVYVDGALPWLAKSGDHGQYADLIAPPQMYGVETDGSEIEYFHGRYMPAAQVWAAFGEEQRWRPRGVHPAQPFSRGIVAKLLMVFGLLFGLLNLGLAGWSLSRPGKLVFKQRFLSSDYLKETTSKPFKLAGGNVVALKLFAPLSNSWISLDVAFVNDKKQVVAEMDNSIEYYHGYSGGESWTEGTRRNIEYFKAPKPGTYRLIIKGSAGRGNRGPPRREPLLVVLYSGVVLTRYFVLMAVFSLMFFVFEFVRKVLFEKRRWAPVLGDDDD